MRNIKLVIEYDGTNYYGWQLQKNTHNTLQETIEKVLKRILQEDVRLIASGRTDAGVHAEAQVSNFKTGSRIALRQLKQALNSLLPKDIVVTKLQEAGPQFHARFDVKSKTYRYIVLNQRHPSVFWRHFAYFVPYELNIALMRKAAKLLVGRHNFSSFQASDGKNSKDYAGGLNQKSKESIRVIYGVNIYKEGNLFFFDIKANGFLYKMVRNIVGTLIEVGLRKRSPTSIKNILAAKNRKFAGITAPACGLILLNVEY